jgi:hypothetical protein
VQLDPEGTRRQAVSDSAGRFRFDRVGRGAHRLRVLQVGYEPTERDIEVGDAGVEVSITMRRLPFALDTARIVAHQTGVFGTIIARAAFLPVPQATVSLMKVRGSQTTGPDGRFEFMNLREGAYVVYARAPRFLPRILSIFVPADSAVELAVTLDSMSAPRAKRLALPLAEFDTRVKFMARSRAALVPRQELAGHENRGVGDALRYSLSFMKTGLVLDDGIACLFVNGRPRPAAIANDYDVSQVESVEVYGLRADWSQTLRWSSGVPCGRPEVGTRAVPGGGAGAPVGLQRGAASRRAPMDNLVRAVVIWLKP